jgi:ABC-type nitrate/sulfonate/bicarbonate transport system substrate-binding protein
VQPVLLRGTPVAVQALVGESLDITMGSADAIVTAAAGGADLMSVAAVVSGLTQAIVANKKYGSIKEHRGTIVGVQSLASGATTVLKRIFKKNGLDYRADYKLLAVGGGNFNLAALTSDWAERNRSLMVRFLKGALRANRWLFANKELAIDFLAKEIQITPELVRKGWDYYTSNRIWHPNAELNLEGMKFASRSLPNRRRSRRRLRYGTSIAAICNKQSKN